jgi:hypothetical protein
MYALCSFSYLAAMIASNHALQFVAYPTQVRPVGVRGGRYMCTGARQVVQTSSNYGFWRAVRSQVVPNRQVRVRADDCCRRRSVSLQGQKCATHTRQF